jgi:hypothetical protein
MKLRELQIPEMTEFTEQYRRNWKERTERISCDRIPKDSKLNQIEKKLKVYDRRILICMSNICNRSQ